MQVVHLSAGVFLGSTRFTPVVDRWRAAQPLIFPANPDKLAVRLRSAPEMDQIRAELVSRRSVNCGIVFPSRGQSVTHFGRGAPNCFLGPSDRRFVKEGILKLGELAMHG